MDDTEKRLSLRRQLDMIRQHYPTLHVPDYDRNTSLAKMQYTLMRLDREISIDDMATGTIRDMYLMCQYEPGLLLYAKLILGDHFHLFLDPKDHHTLAKNVLFPSYHK